MNEDRQPMLPKQVGDRKPIATVRYALWGLAALIAMVMFIQLSRIRTEPSLGTAPIKEKPQNAPSEQVKNFQKQQDEQARRLQQEAEAVRDNAAALNRQIQVFDQATAEAPGVPAPTEQQRRMIAAGVSAPASPGQPAAANPEKTARQKAEEERVALVKSAQESSTVAVDFSDSFGKAGSGATNAKAESSSSGPVAKEAEPEDENRAETPAKGALKADGGLAPEQPQGRIFKLLEGTLLECVLTNRLVGSLAGPVNVMVTTPVYAHDHQTILLPQGTRILGAVTKTGSNQDERLFVAFHRAILPTGYSVNLDQFVGLAQQGHSGLKDQVNRHYFEIFGASIALAAIEAGANAGGNSTGGGSAVRLQSGVGQGTAAGATHIIDQLLNRLPVFTIRERTRVKVYISKDLSLGAYDPNYRLDPL